MRSAILALALTLSSVSALYRRSPVDEVAPLTNTSYYFEQLIDHTNPSVGTFKQRYFFSDAYWTGQGAPIVLSNPGEQSADGFDVELTSKASLQKAVMETLGAAGVVLEHRYWGESSPYKNLSAVNLQYLNIDQAIEDNKYFLENVKLPWTKNATTSHPDVVPWVNMGCSYPGVLSAYNQQTYPNLFAAAWASSAPVQAIGDFWQYFEPIEEGMPKNCSRDAALVVKTVDIILTTGTPQAQADLKASFGLGNVTNDDFGSAIVAPIYPWQGMQAGSFNASGEDPFFKWCDALETRADGKINKKAKGVGLPTALNNYAKHFKANFPDKDCPGEGGACYTTYNYTTEQYTDWTVENPIDRQWYWMICNEFGYWQDGDPGNYSSIVSSLVTENYNLRQCNHMFPKEDGTVGDYSPKITANNDKHKGWNLRAQNLFVVNGQYDPWRSASLSSIWAPKVKSTPHQDVEVIKGGHHCWDFNLRGANFDPDIKRVVDKGVKTVRKWVDQWYKAHPKVKNTLPKKIPDYWGPVIVHH